MRQVESTDRSLAATILVAALPLILSACGEATEDPVSASVGNSGGSAVAATAGAASSGKPAVPAASTGEPAIPAGGAGGVENPAVPPVTSENQGGLAATGGAANEGDPVAAGGSANPPGPVADGAMLSQEGNPVHARFDKYKDFADKADNILSFQLDNGGWAKNQAYDSPGNGGGDKGTFDNGATTMEMTVMADAYKKTGDAKYLEAARKAMDYVLEAQYPEGGWPQYYPLKGGYADHVTFNDNAMSRTLTLLQHAIDKTTPFDGDVFTEEQRSKFQKAVDGGIDYILKAQYVQSGKKTVWCAQHGKSDYQPKKARSYEYPTLSGSESVEIIAFLMTQPQTPEIKEAVTAAVAWFASPDTIIEDYAYEDDKFIERKGSRVWARFYDLETNQPAFSNYDEPLYVGLDQWTKKKSGYRWGGTWGEIVINYAKSVGYNP